MTTLSDRKRAAARKRERRKNEPEWRDKQNEMRRCCYYKRKEYYLDKLKQYRRETKYAVLLHYSNGILKCSCCGEQHVEFLEIDHTHGGGNKHRRQLGIGSGLYFYRWLINNNFPIGYRVLCSNCNKSLGNYGYCPHQVAMKALVENGVFNNIQGEKR